MLASGRMARLEVLDVLEAEVQRLAAVRGLPRLEPQPEMVTQIEAVEHAPREPAGRSLEHRHPVRSVLPLAHLELVHLVARLLAEQGRKLMLSPSQEVDDDGAG